MGDVLRHRKVIKFRQMRRDQPGEYHIPQYSVSQIGPVCVDTVLCRASRESNEVTGSTEGTPTSEEEEEHSNTFIRDKVLLYRLSLLI